jgi:cobalt-zinc-cadmium efflux system outer membrane protein
VSVALLWRRSSYLLSTLFSFGLLAAGLSVAPAAQPGGAPAEPTPDTGSVVRLSLNDALALFLKQNLSVLITKYGIDFSKGQQITAALFPNPVGSIGTLSSYTQGHTLSTGGQLFFQVQ